MENKYFAGIDVGGTKIAGALAKPDGKIIKRVKSPTPKNASPSNIARIIVDLLDELHYATNLKKENLKGVGVGVPGIVGPTGKVLRTPNMRISGADLKRNLETKLKVRCSLGNDVNLGMLGEKWLGAAKNTKNAVGLFLGTGLGAGIIINNALVTGAHGAAAELGHMIIQENGPKCTCGNSGCLEALVGRWAIERDIRQAVKEGKKTVITKLLDKKNSPIKSKVLREAIIKQDGLTTKILRNAAQNLGIACISIRHIFDPEVIVLGGGVMEACGDFILPIVKKTAQKDKFFSFLGACDIVASELKDDAITLGAIALAKSQS